MKRRTLERELHAFEAKLEELLASMGMNEADLDVPEDAGGDGEDEAGEGEDQDDDHDEASGNIGNDASTTTNGGPSGNNGKA
ncbi:hypothetical protein SCUCBS95973_008605 [Sporothrix curviconia]|uniref:Uncharacterized protein n=1 Tax=Sporothrix curviconia TaxID=1260050 RepID=A0ABP0CN32_9PEZI